MWPWNRRRSPPPKRGELVLKSGHFYADEDGYVWCCYQVDTYDCVASCVRLIAHIIQHFDLTACRARNLKAGSTKLIRELSFKEAWTDETYHVRSRIFP